MKKRIISVFLAFAVLVGVFSAPKRAHAAAAGAVAIVSLGVLAWEILDIIIKGEEPAIIVGIRTLMESGVDALTNPDSYFQQTYGDFWKDFGNGYEAIYNSVLEMYENGDIVIKNGEVKLTYDQFYELFDVAYSFVDSFGVDFDTSYSYFAFNYSPGTYLPCAMLPKNDMLYLSNEGESYCLIYYDDNRLIFSGIYFIWKPDSSIKDQYGFFAYTLSSDFFKTNVNSTGFSAATVQTDKPSVAYISISSIDLIHRWNVTSNYQYCFVFDNGNLTYTPVSAVDISGCKTAIVSTIGNFGDFLKSLQSVKFVDTVADNLDDLSTVLPVEESPVLSIPINPDLSVPIPDQVTVSVPGANDLPLSEYMDPLITDIEAPTGLATKFPFCIPFDFVRILSVLAADPIPPVIRIPLSTHPSNLEGFADNETIGEFVAPDDPMFDIDEEIVIDLAHIPLVQPVCYTIFLVGFVIMLIKLTPKLIQH